MKNILKIFIGDVKRIRKNVIAMIVVIGVLVVPCLYAWFNIAASWDPYNNTGNLKVAVASVDEGYTGSLIPIEINVGEQVISALRENTQMDWVFTSKEKAMEGVKSGQYYAAIVVPKKFSTQMMSLFSDQIQKPEIIYYSNAKENAIAPKVTDKGATAIQKQVNQVFIQTISDTAMTVFQSVSNMAEANGADRLVDNLIHNLEDASDDMDMTASTLETFSGITSSAQSLLNTSSDFLKELKTESADGKQILEFLTPFSKRKSDIVGELVLLWISEHGTNVPVQWLDRKAERKRGSSEFINAFEVPSSCTFGNGETQNSALKRTSQVTPGVKPENKREGKVEETEDTGDMVEAGGIRETGVIRETGGMGESSHDASLIMAGLASFL